MNKKPLVIGLASITVALAAGFTVGALLSPSGEDATNSASPASTYATAPSLSHIIVPTPTTTRPKPKTTQQTTPPIVASVESTRTSVPAGYTRIVGLDFKLGTNWVVATDISTPARTFVYDKRTCAAAAPKQLCPGFVVSDTSLPGNKIPFNLEAAVNITDEASGGSCYQDFIHDNIYYGQPKQSGTTSFDGKVVDHMVQDECNITPATERLHSWTIGNTVVFETNSRSTELPNGLLDLFSNGNVHRVR